MNLLFILALLNLLQLLLCWREIRGYIRLVFLANIIAFLSLTYLVRGISLL